jgi:ornithine cyclodeaminase/alanine dehydrogenase-like protein (mu-crystallin family)
MLHLSQEDVRHLLTYPEVVEAVEAGMRQQVEGLAQSVERINLPLGPGHPDDPFSRALGHSAMSVWMAGSTDRGGTIRSLSAGGGIALYVDETGSPAAIIDFPLVQLYRTGAAAAIGTKYFARADSRRFAMLGSGRFGKATLAAHGATMDIEEVRNYSPNKQHRAEFAREMQSEFQLNIRPADSAEEAVADADVIIVCTDLNRQDDPPGLIGEWLRPGVHVTANGGANELDPTVYERASRIVVDDLEEIKQQIWDIKRAVEEGVLKWEQVDELPWVVAGKRPARVDPDEITVVRNRGNGVQDLFPTVAIYRKALETGTGTDIGQLVVPPRPRA